MKKLIVAVIALCIGISAYGQGIAFETGSWKDVLAKAKATNKPIFVDVYTSWCGPCKKMSKDIFPLPEVGKEYNTDFVCYQLDAEKGDGIAVAKQYEVKSYPTYLFVKPDGTLFSRAVGSMSAEMFIKVAQSALVDLNDPKPLSVWDKEYPSLKKDTTFLLGYIKKREKFGKDCSQQFDEYLSLLPQKERVSEKILNLYEKESRNIDIHSLAYKNLIENRDSFPRNMRRTIQYYISSSINNSFRIASKNKDLKLLEEVVAENEKNPSKATSNSKDELYMNFYKETKEWEKYIIHASNYCNRSLMQVSADSLQKLNKRVIDLFDKDQSAFKKAGYDSTRIAEVRKSMAHAQRSRYSLALNDIAWNFFEHATDAEDLQNALKWSERALEISPDNHMFIDTYANLLYKLGQKDKAIEKETEALSIAISTKAKSNGYESALAKMKAGEKTWK